MVNQPHGKFFTYAEHASQHKAISAASKKERKKSSAAAKKREKKAVQQAAQHALQNALQHAAQHLAQFIKTRLLISNAKLKRGIIELRKNRGKR